MSLTVLTIRSVAAVLLTVLGLVIVARGVIEGDPFTYTLMGALMAGLGVYRLRLLRAQVRQR